MTIESLGGYRLVRKLGEGARAEVFLGYPDNPDGQPAVLKMFRRGVAQHDVMVEIEALSRAAGPHVVALLDLATAPLGSPSLILQRLPGGSLSTLLRQRESLRAGEAITILAPILQTLSRLHVAGVAHGGISAESVLFDASGAPVLACFGSATLHKPSPTDAELQSNAAVAADVRAAIDVAERVLDRVDDEQAAHLTQWARALSTETVGIAEQYASRLFEWSVPLPVSFETHTIAGGGMPNRAVTAAPIGETPTRAALAIPEWVQGYLPRLTSIRPRVWAVAAAVAVGLVVAALAVPTGDSDATPEPTTPATTWATQAPGHVAGDDPVAALRDLLETRERCIRDMSVLCLDAVAQSGSSALAADQQMIADLQAGAEFDSTWKVGALTLDERLGDSALVRVTEPVDSEPASFLLVKGEAGWRIRDYLWR